MIILLHRSSQHFTAGYALRFDALTLWRFVWISLGSETIPEDLERESGRIWALPEPRYAAAPLHVAPGFLVDRSSRQRFGAGAWRSSKRRQEDRGGTPILPGVRHCLNRTFRYQHERNIKKQIKCSIWIKLEFLGRPPWWAAVSLGDFRTRGHWQDRVVTVVTWRYLTCNCCISWCNLYIHPDPIGDPTLSQDGSPYLASDLTELISAGASGEVPGNAVGWMSTCEKLWKVGTKRADAWLAGSAGSSGIRNQT